MPSDETLSTAPLAPGWLSRQIAATQEEAKIPIGEFLHFTGVSRNDMPSDETLHIDSPTPAGSQAERLLRFETACEALWPAIRAFGLCGAHPKFLDAVLEIGDLLNKNPPPVDPADIIAAAQRDAIEQVAAFIQSAPEIRGQFGRNFAERAAELIKKLRVSQD